MQCDTILLACRYLVRRYQLPWVMNCASPNESIYLYKYLPSFLLALSSPQNPTFTVTSFFSDMVSAPFLYGKSLDTTWYDYTISIQTPYLYDINVSITFQIACPIWILFPRLISQPAFLFSSAKRRSLFSADTKIAASSIVSVWLPR